MTTNTAIATAPISMLGRIAFIWGFGGVMLLLFFAVYRLAPIAWQAVSQPLTLLQYLLLIANCLFMAYSEGYKGFQRAYSPRVTARAWHLLHNPTPFLALLAPFFCMAFFNAPRKRVITSWVLTLAIILLILLFQRLPAPWRGILDAGVVVGLSWGIIATLIIAFKKVTHPEMSLDPELA